MIVRILSEGQYRVDGDILANIKQLDDDLMEAMLADDEGRFEALLTALANVVRSGDKLAPDHLVESDLILPAADTTLAEAKRLFADPT